jgi:hypothetical protein
VRGRLAVRLPGRHNGCVITEAERALAERGLAGLAVRLGAARVAGWSTAEQHLVNAAGAGAAYADAAGAPAPRAAAPRAEAA